MGVFDSRRMRWIPRSDKIWPPSPMALRMRPLRACEPSRARSSWCKMSLPLLACCAAGNAVALPGSKARLNPPPDQSQIRARYCAGRAQLRSPPRQSCALTDPESRGNGNRRQTYRPPCSAYAPSPARHACKQAAPRLHPQPLHYPRSHPFGNAGQSLQSSPRTSAMWLSPPLTSLS